MGKAKYRSAEADKHKVSLAAASGRRRQAEMNMQTGWIQTASNSIYDEGEKSLTHFQTHSRKSIDNAITDEPW